MKIRSIQYLTVEGFKNVWVNRLMSLASVGVLVACMLLMGVAIALSLNVDKSLGQLEQQNVVMVFFNDERTEEDNIKSCDDIRKMENISEVTFIPKDNALQSMNDQMGPEYTGIFTWLSDENPLPDGAMVKLSNLSDFDRTCDSLSAMPGVKHINGSQEVAKTITAIGRIIAMAGFWIILLLLIIALVIIANTIRITMHNRRLEISIMKAVGATNWFIRLPFIVEGMILGVFSGLLTIGFLYGIYLLAIDSIEKFYSAFSAVPFRSFCFWLCGIFVGIGLLAGVIGSLITLGKYLKREGSAFGAIH